MKTRRLSEKKIHIACDASIFFDGDDGKILLGTVPTRFVYKKVCSEYADGTPIVCYYANIKNGFVAGICSKYGIKKKHVLFPHKENTCIERNVCKIKRANTSVDCLYLTLISRRRRIFVVDVEGEKVNVVFNDVLLTDKDWHIAWNRERQLKSLLDFESSEDNI